MRSSKVEERKQTERGVTEREEDARRATVDRKRCAIGSGLKERE